MRPSLALTLCSTLMMVSIVDAEIDWRTKVDATILDAIQLRRDVDYLVVLTEQAEVHVAHRLTSKRAKGRYVFEALTAVAKRSQAAIVERLQRAGVQHRAFWVTNMIWVEGGGESLLAELASRPDVERISANAPVSREAPLPSLRPDREAAPGEVESSIEHTGAPGTLWAKGYRGQTVVIGAQDSGYDWQHPALRAAYRGVTADGVDHNYNWHDSIHSGGGVCGPDTREPCDDAQHGTHTLGTMVGESGSEKIGMAPAAQWIGCRNMDTGVGTPASYSECFQWFIAPTDLNDENPDPDRAPDIINNSWSCPVGEGCTQPNMLKRVVANTRAAGILVVVSAGNNGPACETVRAQPAIYQDAFSVGATNTSDRIANFSSRGPVKVDGSGRLKPDIVAPGVSIRSSIPGGRYSSSDGTSMAGPHVAGMAALLLSAGACMRGDVDAIEEFLIASAQPITTTESCGGVAGSESPNNTYGWGALRAAVPECKGSPFGGEVFGATGVKAVCTNKSAGKKISLPLAGESTWDCETDGVPVDRGDKVKILVNATADETRAVGGILARFEGKKAICKNLTTRKKKAYRLKGATSWDCESKGLEFSSGDRIKLIVLGEIR